jgi:hypothetical protein
MNKFVYFNDTNRIVTIHPATLTHGCDVDMSGIAPQTIREFILPEGTYAWVKMWDYTTSLQILVSPTSYEKNEGVRHEPVDNHEVPKRELSPRIQELFERSNKAMKKLKEDK